MYHPGILNKNEKKSNWAILSESRAKSWAWSGASASTSQLPEGADEEHRCRFSFCELSNLNLTKGAKLAVSFKYQPLPVNPSSVTAWSKRIWWKCHCAVLRLGLKKREASVPSLLVLSLLGSTYCAVRRCKQPLEGPWVRGTTDGSSLHWQPCQGAIWRVSPSSPCWLVQADYTQNGMKLTHQDLPSLMTKLRLKFWPCFSDKSKDFSCSIL